MGKSEVMEHYFETTEMPQRVQISYQGEMVADSRNVLMLKEKGRALYDPQYYIPREDVKMERLVEMDKSTHCPIKGDTSYFGLDREEGMLEDAAWSYTQPTEEGEVIRDRIAFDQRFFGIHITPDPD